GPGPRSLPASPRAQVHLRPVDGRQHRPGRLGRPRAAGARSGPQRREAGRARRLRGQLPRRRPRPLRQLRGRAGPDRGPLPAGARRDRARRADGDHQPLLPPDLPRRRLHLLRRQGARLRPPENHPGDRPRRRARRQDLRLLGRPRGVRVGLVPEHDRGHEVVPGRDQLPLRLQPGPGLRPPLRPRAEAERAPRRPLPAHRRARPGLHRHPRPAGDDRPQPRVRPRDDDRPQLPPRRRPGDRGGQALSHRPQRPADGALRPGLPLRLREPEAGLLRRQDARGERLRRPAPLRRQGLPDRGRGRRLGLRPRLHALIPDLQGEGAPLRRGHRDPGNPRRPARLRHRRRPGRDRRLLGRDRRGGPRADLRRRRDGRQGSPLRRARPAGDGAPARRPV
ncbi:MAG: Xylose isomerase, partial [uncultured Thermomicrobiales bacterium]